MLLTVQAWEPGTGRFLQGAVAASMCEAFRNIRYF
jgi:hypothetical protein